jgi:hypothetical protein
VTVHDLPQPILTPLGPGTLYAYHARLRTDAA